MIFFPKSILFKITVFLTILLGITNYKLSANLEMDKVIEKVINNFAGKSTDFEIKQIKGFENIRLIQLTDDKTTLRFFGIHKDEQPKINFKLFKEYLLQTIKTSDNKTMVQIIGDSSQFTKEGTILVRNFLNPIFKNVGIIEYGYTGHVTKEENGDLFLDVNAFVNEFIDKNPDHSGKVLANTLGHTFVALTKWGCRVSPQVQNFIVVYNDSGMIDENFTKFGDDVAISDNLLNKDDKDFVVCLEGGAQSFLQVVNSLKLGLKIFLLANIRRPNVVPFFSTARFLYLVSQAFKENQIPSKEDVKKIYDEYNANLKSTWDPKRPDHMTKIALFEKAIFDFIDNETYKLVRAQCNFV